MTAVCLHFTGKMERSRIRVSSHLSWESDVDHRANGSRFKQGTSHQGQATSDNPVRSKNIQALYTHYTRSATSDI